MLNTNVIIRKICVRTNSKQELSCMDAVLDTYFLCTTSVDHFERRTPMELYDTIALQMDREQDTNDGFYAKEEQEESKLLALRGLNITLKKLAYVLLLSPGPKFIKGIPKTDIMTALGWVCGQKWKPLSDETLDREMEIQVLDKLHKLGIYLHELSGLFPIEMKKTMCLSQPRYCSDVTCAKFEPCKLHTVPKYEAKLLEGIRNINIAKESIQKMTAIEEAIAAFKQFRDEFATLFGYDDLDFISFANLMVNVMHWGSRQVMFILFLNTYVYHDGTMFMPLGLTSDKTDRQLLFYACGEMHLLKPCCFTQLNKQFGASFTVTF